MSWKGCLDVLNFTLIIFTLLFICSCSAYPSNDYYPYATEDGNWTSICFPCKKGFESKNCTKFCNQTGFCEYPFNCTICNPGNYSTNGSVCKPCPPGQYNEVEGQSNCFDCPVGTYQPNFGSVKCISCMDGKYSLTKGAASSNSCLSCEQGYFCRSGHKHTCGYGNYCPYNEMIQSMPCEPGHYCPRDNGTTMMPCRIGTYSNDAKTTQCKDCDVNYICPREGMKEPQSCPLIMQRNVNEKACHFGEAFYVILAIGILQVIVIGTVVIILISRRMKTKPDESKLIPTPKGGPSYEGL